MSNFSRIRRIATFPLRHPAVWCWPLALWLTQQGIALNLPYAPALRHYHLPALGLLLLGCVPSLFQPRVRDTEAPLLPRRLLVWLTIGVLIVGCAARIWKVWDWPPVGAGFEEFQIAARGVLSNNIFSNFAAAYSPPGEHALTAYAISVSFALFGPGFFSLRLPFMVAGIACVFFFYAVCRRLVAWEVALFATALFAVSWWQIAGSRVADEIFFPIWAELAIIWLLIEFEDTGRTVAAFFLAFLSALLFYEYTSYHLVLPLLIGYLLARVAIYGPLLVWRAPAGGRGAALFSAIRTYAPGAIVMILVVWVVAQFQFMREESVGGLTSWAAGGVGGHANDAGGLLANLNSPDLGGYLVRRLQQPFRLAYMPGYGGYCLHFGIGSHHGAFDIATALALGIGLVLVAVTVWRRFHALMLVWIAAIIAGAALLPENMNPHRYYTALPMFYLTIALGAAVLWGWLRAPLARYALLGVFAIAVGYAAFENFRYLYWQLIPDPTMTLSWRWPRTEIANWIRSHRRDEWICIIANDEREINDPNPLQPEWSWTVHGWNVRTSELGLDCIPAPADATGGLTYIFAQSYPTVDLEARLRSYYPEARETATIALPDRDFAARTFYVPPGHRPVQAEPHDAAAAPSGNGPGADEAPADPEPPSGT